MCFERHNFSRDLPVFHSLECISFYIILHIDNKRSPTYLWASFTTEQALESLDSFPQTTNELRDDNAGSFDCASAWKTADVRAQNLSFNGVVLRFFYDSSATAA